ncbi:MAG: 16S rRNA (uracil(1498)-N(3))-methyltransferase [Pseudomonadota bacterium]
MAAKIRLYVDHPLAMGQPVPLTRDQAHYLFGVMRAQTGAEVALFNGQDGEWTAEVADVGKRGGTLAVRQKTAPLRRPPDLWLLFAPIKKARTDFIVEKAAEMGAARIIPVQTEFTNAERVRRDRLQAHAIEAAEQCGGTFVPEVAEMRKLADVITNWPVERHLMFCDETLAGQAGALDTTQGRSWAILVGPEGGFSARERRHLLTVPTVSPVALGPRILRADTAAVAAMALWQKALGDWT